MLTKANMKNTAMLLFVACYVYFNVFLRHVHTASISASQRKTTTLRTEFTEGPNTKVTSTSTSVDSSELVTTLATMSAGNCVTNSSGTNSGIAYHFEASTNYRQSATLPQWIKGTVHYYTLLYYVVLYFLFKYPEHDDDQEIMQKCRNPKSLHMMI